MVIAGEILVAVKLADLFPVDRPNQTLRRPVKDVGMIFVGRVADIRLGASIVVASDTFAKDVGLYFAGLRTEVASTPFPVNLVQAVGHQHCTSDDTSAFRSLGNDFNFTEEEIKTTPNVRSIKTFCKCEFCTIASVVDNGLVGKCPIRRLLGLFGKINGVFFRRKTWDGRAFRYLLVSHRALISILDDLLCIGLHCAFANPAAARALKSGKSIIATKPHQFSKCYSQ